MNKEERFEISVNQEDVQNIINCYEKDIEYIKKLENNWNELKEWLENELKLKHLFEYDCAIKDVIYIMQEIESRK